ncbi:MAG TPA: pitrilysin family protein, partial [Saprospiraceae bacterium]|nr:pitrilysin family protein [Saprospiraceae bacterium]
MKIYRKSIIPLLLAVWTIAAITSLKAQLTGNLQQNSPIPFHESVRTGTLSNGMKYYLLKNAKPEHRVEIRLALKAGSILEDEDQKGVAHFVEHMCFNGSKNFKKNELIDYLEKTGTKFGADLNAYTSFDETVYMLELRTDDQAIFNKGLLVFEDWAGGVNFDHEEIDKERGVVESEWRTRLSPEQRMQNRYFPVIYAGSQYGKRLPIGDMEIIRHAPYDNFKRFYRDWYRPDLMALIMVGDFDLNAVEKQVKERFSKLKNPAKPRPRT